jgi:hypothetical protein
MASIFLPFIFYFFDKEYILISRRYQLHPTSATTQYSNSITDAHNQKMKEELQKKSPPTVFQP